MRAALIAVAAIVLCAALFLTYQAGVNAGHAQVEQDRATISRLNNSITQLTEQLDTSEQNLIIAQRHQQIQAEAYDQINDAYASSERKNSYLGSRLDFYRSIISPEDGSSGPGIQALEATRSATGVSFDVTLVQAIKHKEQVRGAIEVRLSDASGRTEVWPKSGPRSVNYQYFEQISGAIEVAEVSDNAKLNVKLILQNGDMLERSFALADVLAKN